MRRRSRGALALASTLAFAATPSPALAAIPSWRDASARLIACHRARIPADRYLTVEGSMHALGPGEHLEIRFDLSRRRGPGTPFARVPGPGLGSYRHATAGAGGYRFRKTIQNLPGPAEYRVSVTFGWLAVDGSQMAHAVRSAPVCRQPGQPAALEAGPSTAVAGAPGS
ncbi:MAG: hypothetical protein ACJ76S_10835 [Solirubrobacteraceae bacterium]|jgi:hypothetical protein